MDKKQTEKLIEDFLSGKKGKKILTKIIRKIMKTDKFKKIVNNVLEDEFNKMTSAFTETMKETLGKIVNPETYESNDELLDVCPISDTDDKDTDEKDNNSSKVDYYT